MQVKTAKRFLLMLVVLLSMILTVGCAGQSMKKATVERLPGYLYYPAVLVDADQALKEARKAGKDTECPAEYAEAKGRVDKAYEEYLSCKQPGPLPINIVCPPKCELEADKSQVKKGECVKLTLTTHGTVTSAVLDGTDKNFTDGSMIVTPDSTTTYTAKVSGPGGSATCSSCPVTVINPQPPACTLTAVPEKVELGGTIKLTLTTTGEVTSAEVDGSKVAPAGETVERTPDAAKNFTGKVEGPGGSATCSVPVSVSLTLHVNFPFDRPKPKKDDIAKWFVNNKDAYGPNDPLDPECRKHKVHCTNKHLEENHAELDKAVKFVRNNSDATIKLFGHTDSKGTDKYNDSLSDRRVKAVAGYLIHNNVIEGDKISEIKGLGKREPLTACEQTASDGKDNPECRAENRRVVITASPK